jgi:antirestriction protein ArdC
MNHVGLETQGTFRNSTAYIQNWLTALRNDKRMIVTSSGAAAKAFDYITAPA